MKIPRGICALQAAFPFGVGDVSNNGVLGELASTISKCLLVSLREPSSH
ncbi:hypothetical protein NtB2_00301 [Lactococcus termiticola]|uniref:Uncharacterized protein n=1 Tax=Lactococcus termiticola TaxID=2169526 RepID=A0A2R5HIM3_9LACT|nr:hypothetical protein NtB2_00301 [Lactococcus termiticola]